MNTQNDTQFPRDHDRKIAILLWDRSVDNAWLTDILEQMGYQSIHICDDPDPRQLQDVMVEIILYDCQSLNSSMEQKLEQLKSLTQAPALCLIDAIHAPSVSEDKIKQCDDFILKPFSPEEMLLRIHWTSDRQKLLKSAQKKIKPAEIINMTQNTPKKELGKPYFKIDEGARQVIIKGKPIHLTPKEYALFCLLASKVGHIFTNQEIIATLWPNRVDATDKDVQQYIYSLRRKIEPNPIKPSFLLNAPGFGYKLVEPKEQEESKI